MKFKLRPFVSTAFAALLAAPACASQPAASSPAPDSTGASYSLFEFPTEDLSPIVNAINSAQTSVHMTMYHMTIPDVIDALENAKNRGVDVEVIMDRSSTASGTNETTFNDLSNAGVQIRKSSSAFTITHEKAFVVDNATAFVMSMNMTKDYYETRDYGLITQDSSIVSYVSSLFDADWQNAADGSGNTTPTPPDDVLVSPVNSDSGLVALIGQATSEIDATVENISNPDVMNAMIAAVSRNVSVRLIVPECTESSTPTFNYPYLTQLATGGVQTRVMGYPSSAAQPYMHGKMIVVDGSQAYVGSINYSDNSIQSARELGVIVHDTSVVPTLQQSFETDWAAAVTPPADPSTLNCPVL